MLKIKDHLKQKKKGDEDYDTLALDSLDGDEEDMRVEDVQKKRLEDFRKKTERLTKEALVIQRRMKML